MRAVFMAIASIVVKEIGRVPIKDVIGFTGWAGHPLDAKYWIGNIFAEDQSVLDAIAADPRTEFVIPIEVTGKTLGWKNKDDDLPANLHGKITAWIVKNKLHKLDPNMKKPGQIAKHIMAQVSGVEDVDPLKGFRVFW